MFNLFGQQAKLLRKVTQVESVRGPTASKEWERLAVHTLTFANPPGVESLGVRIDHGDIVKIVIPNHKPKSYSMSAERPGEFDITFKVYPGGICSGYLDRLEIGQEATVFRKGKKERYAGSHVGLVAYGVGITEALPVAAAELGKSDAGHVKLLWAAKTYGDLFWHREIAALHAAHPQRFTYETILSREERKDSRHGRVTSEVLADVFDGAWGTSRNGPNADRRAGVRFLTVGTKAMMRQTYAHAIPTSRAPDPIAKRRVSCLPCSQRGYAR